MNPTYWHRRTVFVTGGTGLVGRWLIDRLVREGALVVALTRGTPAFAGCGLLPGPCHTVAGQLEDAAGIGRILAEYAPDTVFHLAAQSQALSAVQHPLQTLETNVRGTWNLLEACRTLGRPQIVLASSEKVYGEAERSPLRETDPLFGTNPYDASKLCAEAVGRMYAKAYGLPIAIMRNGNIFGGGDSNFDRLIPGVIRETYHGRRFTLRSNGLAVRDYLYVDDAVDACLRLAEWLATQAAPHAEAFNFSCGQPITALEAVSLVLRIMDREDMPPLIQNVLACESQQYMTCEKALDRLQWRPRVSLEEGLSRTVCWYRSHFDGQASSAPALPLVPETAMTRSTYEDTGLPGRSAL